MKHDNTRCSECGMKHDNTRCSECGMKHDNVRDRVFAGPLTRPDETGVESRLVSVGNQQRSDRSLVSLVHVQEPTALGGEGGRAGREGGREGGKLRSIEEV